MPRVSRVETERNREKIIEVSSHLFREKGFQVSVADLMSAAGLTPGGFYGHFESKEHLEVIASELALNESIARWQVRIEDQPNKKAARTNIITNYLSTKVRDNPGSSCAFSGLVVDVGRESNDSQVRDTYAKALGKLVGILEDVQEGKDKHENRGEALIQVSTLIGALLLARATEGKRISNEILTAVKDRLVA